MKRIISAFALTAVAVAVLAGCTSAPAHEAKAEPKLVSWADKVYGTFKPITVSGSKAKDVKVPAGIEAAVITFTNGSDGSFTVSPVSKAEAKWLIDAADGEAGGLTIPAIAGEITGAGRASMSSVWGIDTSDQAPAVRFHVESSGDWKLRISPIGSLPALGQGGSGDGSYLYGGPGAGVTFAHEGTGSFTVTEYSSAITQHLVNEGEKTPKALGLTAGPTVIQVHADGRWTAKRG